MKIAIVHDWLTGMRGGEKVLEVLCELFPEAVLHTLIHIKGCVSPTIEKMKIKTSFLQNLPFVAKRYRYYLPFMPQAIESFDMSEYNLIISVSHCVAKGIIPSSKAVHICYCNTPVRYAWEMYDQYFNNRQTGLFTRMVAPTVTKKLRDWDFKTCKRVNYFVANSNNVGSRIKRYYQREFDVIYPPVDIDFYKVIKSDKQNNNYYLIISAFAPYKKIDIAIKAFNILGYPLKIIGTGQEEKKLKSIAKSNIEFLGWESYESLRKYYSNCKAFIFPGEEDFGITPVEAQACGKPVIAYGKGGVLETVIPDVTGIFFQEQTPESLIEAVKKFETMKFDGNKIRENTIRFNYQRFKTEINKYIQNKTKHFF